MAWRAEQSIGIRCPRCGSIVAVPVDLDHIDLQPVADQWVVRVFFVQQVNVNGHACSDSRPPIDRFLQDGHLDDPMRK